MSQKVKMPERDPKIRKKDFKQVNTGYTRDEMLKEAKRCLQCKNPSCSRGCPVEVNIPGFIKYLAGDNPSQAVKVLKQKNNLPAVCGRVCPQENQCERLCILGKKGESICIGNLERYATDIAFENNDSIAVAEKSGVKVAVVGSGPAGLTCGGDLLKMGYDVTVYESLHSAGGVLRYGIPEFRLPKEVLDKEINNLKKLGMKIILNTLIGRTRTMKELFNESYKAIFISVGAGLPVFPGIEGENLNHVYCSNEFLVRVNLMRSFDFPNYDTPVYRGKNVVVIGGGNTAMDSARTALRLGAESVKLIYRRTEKEMPAREEERLHARKEGIEFIVLTNPVKFIGDEKKFVKAVECIKMELGGYDDSGRRHPQEIKESNYAIETDMVILALGLHPNPVLTLLTEGLNTDRHGYIIIDDNYMTSVPGVFAGGDIVGGDTVIEAMGMGKKAARSIACYLNQK
ncbi:glutamate synthase (NADPH), homotetrameric [Endomicrobiia bacterium]|nr:glutamate synthase (NADPH), homotetrameric [Endomicrobiia bacterium]GHT11822.1 glutamate synthase (NADPH), homotetrameric [Endomicrobiia bacterium]GHT19755.1 glutamate synthase (NADPH), homotetrameric [Endomicrobiia bacterium]GHT26615.1 glutamate synthase (NADPH), homotetrameric [Endomicrobiia bacterium]GHT29613.1 glutamate synthase (NADPH), homotetrameric [Endomicrobiia bacterium]